MTRYSYLIVRTGTFKYFQQDRKNWKIPQKNFENLRALFSGEHR